MTLGRAGLDAYSRGEWRRAYEAFEHAEAIAHSPVFLLYMARAQRNSGALLQARALYRRVTLQALPEGAPESWRSAISDAVAEANQLERRIPSVVVSLGRAAEGAVVSIDGRPIPALEVSAELELDAGVHRLVVERAGKALHERSFELKESQRALRVHVPGAAEASAAAPERAERGRGPSSAPNARFRRRVAKALPHATSATRYAAYSAGGIGVLGVASGVVLGVLAAIRLDDIESRCEGRHCLTSDARNGDAFRDLAALSTVAFTVGGAGLGASALLLWSEPPPTAERATRRAPVLMQVGARF